MSTVSKNEEQNSNNNTNNELLFWEKCYKKFYGVGDEEIEDIKKYADEIIEALNDVLPNILEDGKLSFSKVVDIGNKIPSYCSLPLVDYIYQKNPNILFDAIDKMNQIHNKLFDKDPSSTATTDLYETLSCILTYSPSKILRKFIPNHFESTKEIMVKMKKRPVVISTISARLSEIFLASKGDVKYAQPIIDILQQMLDFLAEKNNLIAEIPDAININFKELKPIIKDFMDKGTKKESLKKINGLINKKSDIGQAFYDWVLISPSTSSKIISLDIFTPLMLESFIKQLKLQHAVEMGVLLRNKIPDDKYKIISDYLTKYYELNSYLDYTEKLSNLAMKEDSNKYGILLRYIQFLPIKYLEENETFIEGILYLQKKLSSVANNLTAKISEKSFSITISPMSRSRIYQDIVDSVNKTKGISNEGFAAKVLDKDVVKKIKEGGTSFLATDQYTGMIVISAIESLVIYIESKSPEIKTLTLDEKKQVIIETYKIFVSKFGNVATKEYFTNIVNIIMNKVVSKNSANMMDEDEIDEEGDTHED